MPSVALITPTRDRPSAFARCEKWISRQTRAPDQWIVVDDGDRPIKPMLGQQHVRRQPETKRCTLPDNLLAGLALVESDVLLIIEDDDWYAPNYIASMLILLSDAELVGFNWLRYFHLRTRGWRVRPNMKEVSALAHTGLRKEQLPLLAEACKQTSEHSVDRTFWLSSAHLSKSFAPRSAVWWVGIKGGHERAGLGRGHDAAKRWQPDPKLAILKAWLGTDVQVFFP